MRTLVLALLLVGLLAGDAAAQVAYVREPPFTEAYGDDGGLADLDGDGDLDVVQIESGYTLATYSNDGTGHFTALPKQASYSSRFAGTADFDGDGKLDVLLAASDSAVVRFGGGDGTLPAELVLHEESAGSEHNLRSLRAVTPAQIDGAGRPEIAAVSGAGAFALKVTPERTAQWSSPQALAGTINDAVAVDLGADAYDDLAVASDAGLLVLHGSAAGTFGAPSTAAADAVMWLLAADTDGNGRDEVISGDYTVQQGTALPPMVLTVWEPGAGTLQKGPSVELESIFGSSHAVGDVDADGAYDLIFAGHWDDHVLVFLGEPDGGLFGPIEVDVTPAHYFPEEVSAGDLTGDGFTDLLVEGRWVIRNAPWTEFSAATLGFGEVPVGQVSTPLTVTAFNVALAPLSVASLTVDGSQFRLLSETCSGRVFGFGLTCAARVAFAPTAPGPAEGWLDFASNDPEPLLGVQLLGTGRVAAVPTPAPITSPALPPPVDGAPAARKVVSALARAVRRTGMRRLARARSVSVRVDAPAGVLSASVRSGRTTVARGSATRRSAGRVTVVVKLTAAGRRLVRSARRLRLTIRVTVTPAGGAAARATAAVTVRR